MATISPAADAVIANRAVLYPEDFETLAVPSSTLLSRTDAPPDAQAERESVSALDSGVPMVPRARGRKRRDGTNAVVGLLLTLFVVVGLFEVVSGGTTTSGNAVAGGSSAPTSAPLTTIGPSRTSCSTARLLTAMKLVRLLKSKGFPVIGALPTSPPTTAGLGVVPAGPVSSTAQGLGKPCTSATFADKRGGATNDLAVYPSPTVAQRSATSQGTGTSAYAIGPAVLFLDPSLAPFRSAYIAALTGLVATATT